MKDKFSKYLGLHGWVLRAAYIGTLLIFGIVCFQFYVEQKSENKTTNGFRQMADNFAQVDEKFRALSAKAMDTIMKPMMDGHDNMRVDKNTSENVMHNMMQGMGSMHNSMPGHTVAPMPMDSGPGLEIQVETGSDVQFQKDILQFHVADAATAFENLLEAWQEAGGGKRAIFYLRNHSM